jgi:hypothetical protein
MASNGPQDTNSRRLQREKLVFKYTQALERGDWETVGAVLRLAETDALLESMLTGVDTALDMESEPLARPLPVRQTAPPANNLNHHYAPPERGSGAKGTRRMSVIQRQQSNTLTIPYTLLVVAAAMTLIIGAVALMFRGGGDQWLSPGGENQPPAAVIGPDDPEQTSDHQRGRCVIALTGDTRIGLATEPGGDLEVQLDLLANTVLTAESRLVTVDDTPWILILQEMPVSSIMGWTPADALPECTEFFGVMQPTAVPPVMTATPVNPDAKPDPAAMSVPVVPESVDDLTLCVRTLPAGTRIKLGTGPGFGLTQTFTLVEESPVEFSFDAGADADDDWRFISVRTRTISARGWLNASTLDVDFEDLDACETGVSIPSNSIEGLPIPLVTIVPTVPAPPVVTATPSPMPVQPTFMATVTPQP